jgi:hypothetical protein
VGARRLLGALLRLLLELDVREGALRSMPHFEGRAVMRYSQGGKMLALYASWAVTTVNSTYQYY